MQKSTMTGTRYVRHDLIDWFSQKEVNELKVIVIGAGAVGNEVIKDLTLLGVGNISIFDFDHIEQHNLTRSVLFRESDIGQAKANIAAARARELDPNITIRSYVGDFWSLLGVRDLSTYDLVFCCVDNFEARIRCNTMCLLAKVDLINLGIDSRFGVVETFRFGSLTSACYECGLPESVYQRMAQRYSCGHLRKLSFIERKIPTTIVTSSAAAAIGVSQGLRLGAQPQEQATRVLVDTISGLASRIELLRNPLCPACARLPAELPLMSCRRRIDANHFTGDLDAITVTLSEPVLTGYRIGDTHVNVFKRASDFDDSFASLVSDVPDMVNIEIRDQFTLSELIGRYAGHAIPTKFALLEDGKRSLVLEFEGEENE